MNERYYVLETRITSQDTEVRNLTPYDVLETAQRKYHEALTGIGAGSKKIAVVLLDSNLNQIQKEVWIQYVPEPEPTEESESTEESEPSED